MKAKEQVRQLRERIDKQLVKYLRAKNGFPPVIFEAVRYSVSAGGKRIRPVLMLLAGRACGLKYEAIMPAACAMEMIHTYSLIHDDLPAMDDDDTRRGRPTSHVKFGEANAILAGDALLTKAFEIFMLCAGNRKIKPAAVIKAAAILAKSAGINGMVGGQAADILFEGKKTGKKQLSFIHSRKTGELIKAAVTIPAVLSGKPGKIISRWKVFGGKIGLAFQVADDILDVTGASDKLGKTAGKDAKTGKATYPALYGLEESRKIAAKLALEAGRILCKINGDTRELEWLVDYIINRTY
jgi:geranylgeranyl diphosphate synthase, type II